MSDELLGRRQILVGSDDIHHGTPVFSGLLHLLSTVID
jgi:hypothetical protein